MNLTLGVLACAAFALATAVVAAPALDTAIGKRLFERNWVSAPSSTKSDDGLGPFYDATSCASCHALNPSAPASPNGMPAGLVIRLGNGRGDADPIYGAQLQTRAVAGLTPEAKLDIKWSFVDGLRKPTITLRDLGYGTLDKNTRISLRRAPPLKGIGLLAQVPESEILKHADPEDVNRDGVEGRVPWVYVGGKRVLGRFGWKATQPDLAAQSAMAFSRDIGLSTRLQPAAWGDCTPAERACRDAPQGSEKGEPEVADSMLDMIVAYVASLAAPAPAKSERGEALFNATGCAACHTTLHLADGKPVPAYTDLLLHDMGAGLGDGIEEGSAGSWTWRTAPLWGVSDSLKAGGLLHDGRAADVTEAIAWHDGEAWSAREHFRALSTSDKAALVAFVSGL